MRVHFTQSMTIGHGSDQKEFRGGKDPATATYDVSDEVVQHEHFKRGVKSGYIVLAEKSPLKQPTLLERNQALANKIAKDEAARMEKAKLEAAPQSEGDADTSPIEVAKKKKR